MLIENIIWTPWNPKCAGHTNIGNVDEKEIPPWTTGSCAYLFAQSSDFFRTPIASGHFRQVAQLGEENNKSLKSKIPCKTKVQEVPPDFATSNIDINFVEGISMIWR